MRLSDAFSSISEVLRGIIQVHLVQALLILAKVYRQKSFIDLGHILVLCERLFIC